MLLSLRLSAGLGVWLRSETKEASMGDVVEMNSEGFFASLVGLDADEAVARCKVRADEWRDDLAHLHEKLGQTARADKQGAHAIKQAILRTQSKLQRLKPVVASYRATLEKRETHSLWVEGVRAVCGHDALHEVYDWMATEKKRRTQVARDAQAPQFSAPNVGSNAGPPAGGLGGWLKTEKD